MKDRTWWRLLGCGLPLLPLLFLMVPLFYLGVRWMAAHGLPREQQ